MLCIPICYVTALEQVSSASEFQLETKIHCQFPPLSPNTLMKFSMISLIAAGLTTILYSTIAAPCPPYARALVVDGGLFKRHPNDELWKEHSRTVAGALLQSSLYNHHTSQEALKVSSDQINAGSKSPEVWQKWSGAHGKISSAHAAKALLYLSDSNWPQKGELYKNINRDFHEALLGQHLAKQGSDLAKAARNHTDKRQNLKSSTQADTIQRPGF